MGALFALGIIVGVVIAMVIVRGLHRRYVDLVFPLALAAAVIVGLLALLSGHGLGSIADAAVLAVGEVVGIGGTALLGGRVMDALEEHH